MPDPNEMDFGALLQRLASSLNPSVTRGGGAGGLSTGLLDTNPQGPRADQLDMRREGFFGPEYLKWILSLTDVEQDQFLRKILGIPSVGEGQRIIPPEPPAYAIERLRPLSPSPSQMPMIRPSADLTWPWQL